MLKKIHRFALPLAALLFGLAFASVANADHSGLGAPTLASATTDPSSLPVSGDPDSPSLIKRLGESGPSDYRNPGASTKKTWFGFGTVWMRIQLSGWLGR
jgi:hypothetical protein